MKSTMLIISTDLHLFERMFSFFGQHYRMELAQDEMSGIKKITQLQPEVILLSYHFPRIGGIEMCTQVRYSTQSPIFIFGNELTTEERIHCFEVGADDIVSDHVHPKEIYHRIQVLKRRNRFASTEDESNILILGQLVMNRTLHSVHIDGEELVLTRKEFALLWVLVEHHNQVVRRKDLVTAIWGYDYVGDDRMLDTHLNRLRKKLHGSQSDLQITTIWGLGYKLERASKGAIL